MITITSLRYLPLHGILRVSTPFIHSHGCSGWLSNIVLSLISICINNCLFYILRRLRGGLNVVERRALATTIIEEDTEDHLNIPRV